MLQLSLSHVEAARQGAVSLIREIRLRPFDTSSPEGRGRERRRRAILSAGAAAFSKALSMVTILVSVPLTLNYLGAERFGIWATLMSLLLVLSFADLGIGNGVLTEVAHAQGADDHDALLKNVSSGFGALGVTAAIFLGSFLLVQPLISWPSVFHVQTPVAREEIGSAVIVFATLLFAGMPINAVQRIQTGMQEGFKASFWQSTGSLLGLAGLLTAISLKGSLPWLIAAAFGGPIVANLINSAWYFGYSRRDLVPRVRFIEFARIKALIGTGKYFLVLQLVAAITYASDNLIITQVLGPATVPEYSVPEKMFSLVSIPLGMLLAPLWPAYTEAASRGDRTWIKATLRNTLIGSSLTAAFIAAVLVLVGNELLALWVKQDFRVPGSLLGFLAVAKVLEVACAALSMFLNGMRILRLQVLFGILMAVAAIGLKIALAGNLGIVGIPISTIAVIVLFTALPWTFLLPRVVRQI